MPLSWITGEGTRDSLLLARLADENRGPGAYGLEKLAASVWGMVPWKAPTDRVSKTNATLWASVDRVARCRTDAWVSARLVARYADAAPAPLLDVVHRIASTIDRVCLAGLVVDLAEFDRRAIATATRVEGLAARLAEAAAEAGMLVFAPTNDNHIRSLLFEHLALEPPARTKTGLASVDKTTLRELGHPTADLLLEFSEWDKVQTTAFVGKPGGKANPIAALLHRYGPTRGYLPLHINPLGARTGRRSSNYPNCQNWTKDFRRIVTSRWLGGLVADCDYSRLEMVLIALAAGDEDLLAYFTTGEGYIGIARWLWGRVVVDGSNEYRASKSLQLGINYGMGPGHMARDMWYRMLVRLAATYEEHADVVRQMHRRYLRRFWRLRQYARAREAEMLETGQVVSAVGQVRHLPGADRSLASYGHLLNQAINFPIQCLASYVTGCALVDVERELLAVNNVSYSEHLRALLATRKKWLTTGPACGIMPTIDIPPDYDISVICNEVHDDIVVDLHPAHPKRDIELVVETMRAVPSLVGLGVDLSRVLRVGVKTSTHWCGE